MYVAAASVFVMQAGIHHLPSALVISTRGHLGFVLQVQFCAADETQEYDASLPYDHVSDFSSTSLQATAAEDTAMESPLKLELGSPGALAPVKTRSSSDESNR